ncbi:MAG: hypothetical protein H2069_10115 [Legionella sp.]|nr:hypothetical protein [Legionella sp.]
MGILFLWCINFLVLYLIYWYVSIVGSIIPDNFLHIPYEPSGMQLYFFILSLPLFLLVAALSLLHSYYFQIKKSLCTGTLMIWLAYFFLIVFVDRWFHFSAGNHFLYQVSLFIAFFSVLYVVYSTYRNTKMLVNKK